MKKGQLAVETILIYGLAVFIVILAIAALWASGFLDFSGALPDQCEIGQGIICENYLVQASDAGSGTDPEVQLELTNQMGQNIEIKSINVVGEGNNAGIWACTQVDYGATPLRIFNGDTSNRIDIQCDLQAPEGTSVQGRIDIVFSAVGSSIDRTAQGNIRATVAP